MTRRREELRRQTGHLSAGLPDAEDKAAPARPAIGDLWVQRSGAETTVQWAVVDVAGTRVLAVPATPVAADPEEWIEAEEVRTGSALVLHAECPASLALDRLEAGARTGRVDTEAVDATRRALGLGPVGRSSAGPATGDRARRSPAGTWPLRLAASLLLVLLGALVGDRLRPSRAVPNVPIVPLVAEETYRSADGMEAQHVTLPPGADSVVLWLAVGEPAVTAPPYRLALRTTDRAEPRWIAAGLEVQHVDGLPFLSVAIPTRLLGEGAQIVELVAADSTIASRTYRFLLDRPTTVPEP